MNLKLFLTVFGTIFLAEIGDKTQLATLLYAAESRHSKWAVFCAAALALTLAAGIAVVAGEFLGRMVPPRTLKLIAGFGFIAVGVWTLRGIATG